MSVSTEKVILVLANSLKKGGRCVAGVEATLVGDNKYLLGDWIRPVDSSQDEGTIPNHRIKLLDRTIKPLELVAIRYTGSANDAYHPEDMVIDGTAPWVYKGFMAPSVLNHLVDDTGDLWGAETASSRKVIPKPGTKTLRLIKPKGRCYVTAFREDTQWGKKNRRKLHIEHQGATHQFSIDDPYFSERHKLSPSEVGDRTIEFELDPTKLVVVASLTKPFVKDGFQYKIAATIFEL